MKFKELLKEKDINGAQLARRLGVHRGVVSTWVRGLSVPRTIYLKPLAKCLGVSVEELMDCFDEGQATGK